VRCSGRAGDRLGQFQRRQDLATPVATLLPTVDASSGGFAFSFWGGDFWFYTANDTPSTSVAHYVSATQTASVVLNDIGFTCFDVRSGRATSAAEMTMRPVAEGGAVRKFLQVFSAAIALAASAPEFAARGPPCDACPSRGPCLSWRHGDFAT